MKIYPFKSEENEVSAPFDANIQYVRKYSFKLASRHQNQHKHLHTGPFLQTQHGAASPRYGDNDISRDEPSDGLDFHSRKLIDPFFPSSAVTIDADESRTRFNARRTRSIKSRYFASRTAPIHKPKGRSPIVAQFRRVLSQASPNSYGTDPGHVPEKLSGVGGPYVEDEVAEVKSGSNRDTEYNSPGQPDEDEVMQTEFSEVDPEGKQYKVIVDKHRSMFKDQDSTTEVYPYTLGYTTSIHMIQTLRKLRAGGLPDHIKTSAPDTNFITYQTWAGKQSQSQIQLSKVLRRRLFERTSDPQYQRLAKERESLPIQRPETVQELITMVATNDVVVLVSQTGSGKSTQLPQLILEWKTALGRGTTCNIVCTQPRRLAAIAIARRVAQEQRTYVGGHVGYSVRFDRQMPRFSGSIGYWTAAILLKSLYEQPQTIIDTYSHLVIDEVHERDTTTDLVLTALRDLMRTKRSNGERFPKVILMSATIDAFEFQRYFEEPFPGIRLRVASLEVAGRNFGVEEHVLEDIVADSAQHAHDGRYMTLLQNSKKYLQAEDEFADAWTSSASSEDLISLGQQKRQPSQYPAGADDVPIELTAATIAHAFKTSREGDLLVFLPGIGEIDRVAQCLLAAPLLGLDFSHTDKIRICKLHASLYETNEQVFEAIPDGCRRVVLATNIAQTSITLPDVVHVVDAGQQRKVTYNPISHVNEFKCYWIDKSASTQRKGRAGRTRPGHYWTLFTKARYDSFPDKPLPEIQTTDLTPSCLAIKAQVGNRDSLKTILGRIMDPPDPALVEPAIEELKKLRMFDETEEVTPLGRFAAWFPLPPATSRALLLGVLFGCLEPMLIMASHNADKPLIHSSKSIRSQIESMVSFAAGIDDDRAAYLAAFRSFDAALKTGSSLDLAELERQNVRHSAYKDVLNVAHQLCDLLSKYQLLDIDHIEKNDLFDQLPLALSENASSSALVKSLALTMQHSNLGVYNSRGGSYYVGSTPVLMKPFSVNAKAVRKLAGHPDMRSNGQLVAYSVLMQVPGTSLPLMTETSNVTPLMAMLFGGPIEVINKNTVEINGWLKYRIHVQDKDGNTVPDDGSAVSLILEFRRTLDRFIQLTCASLRRSERRRRRSDVPDDVPSDSPLAPGNPLTATFTQGLKAIVDSDAFLWDENLLRDAAENPPDERKSRVP